MKILRSISNSIFIALALGTLSLTHAGEGEWKSLFNGKDFDGWEYRGKMEGGPIFKVEDGVIVASTVIPRNPTTYMATTKSYGDFELVFDSYVEKNLNTGVQFRSTAKGSMVGPQLEIDNNRVQTGYIWGQGMKKWLSPDWPKKNPAFKPNEWNTYRLKVVGKNIKTWINDQPIEDVTQDEISDSGVIALQAHSYPSGKDRAKGAEEVVSVYWKNIKIREIE
ncbi:MAG: DUF1080 domain-containing protein [Verrucomicrobiota bacterium]